MDLLYFLQGWPTSPHGTEILKNNTWELANTKLRIPNFFVSYEEKKVSWSKTVLLQSSHYSFFFFLIFLESRSYVG